jgi:translation initiation factor 2B subunit (eIF-2B alpha/beta/delta family)
MWFVALAATMCFTASVVTTSWMAEQAMTACMAATVMTRWPEGRALTRSMAEQARTLRRRMPPIEFLEAR